MEVASIRTERYLLNFFQEDRYTKIVNCSLIIAFCKIMRLN